MTAPALPREVWAYAWKILPESQAHISASQDFEEVVREHAEDAVHVIDKPLVSPIGRYVLADTACDRCSGQHASLARVDDRNLCARCWSDICQITLDGCNATIERAAIVAWLRKSEGVASESLHEMAVAIERGEHRRVGR